ncbi:MAG: anaerobic ribonucleoside triphosphate reductase [Clostridia bacterium]|nr:anaerobic ribonucleoside triphosphate reductase [Clostridia bacterium]
MKEDDLANIIVIKRSGKRVSFDGMKIAVAIKKGFDSIEGKYNEDDINKTFNKVMERIKSSNLERIKIEQIQDWIEEELKKCGYEDVYKSYSKYREKRNQSREIFFEEKRKHKFLKALEKLGLNSKDSVDTVIDDKNSMEKLQAYGEAVAEEFATSYLIKKRFSDSHENGDIFINKLECYPIGSTESTQIDLEKLFTDGFSTEKCSIREPQSIVSYATLAIIAICNNQRDQSGNQSIPAFDYYMAPGVLKTFKKEFQQTIYDILEYTDYDKFIAINGIEREIDKISSIDFDIEQFYKFTRDAEELKRMFRIVYKKALLKTNKQVYQAMEGFVHDLNSICDERITTINLGTDTSKEGRMVIQNLLRTIDEGIGENKRAISPKVVFKIKKGINFEEKDPNYDLLKMACNTASETSNIAFSFLDTQFNSQFYKEGDFNTEVAYFEDGTRVIDNYAYREKQITQGRGVLSSTVINLPRIALKHRDNLSDFYDEVIQKIDLCCEQLLERLEIQGNKRVYNFPFLMKQNVWIDSERLRQDDRVKRLLRHGILQVGFTGLNECVIALTGKRIADSKKSQNLGICIIQKMNDRVEELCKKYNYNFIVSGIDNEYINQEFMELDRIVFGKIKNITDKEMYTPSFNSDDSIDINKRIRVEAQFHELTAGAHKITIKRDELGNGEKEEKGNELINIIKEMYKNEVGFAVIK